MHRRRCPSRVEEKVDHVGRELSRAPVLRALFSHRAFSQLADDGVAGIITTVAWDGTQSYSGDGASATSAHFGLVSGLAMDLSGNLYVFDQFYNAVRMLRVSSAPRDF
jgi:hypothetical protein